MIPFPNPSEYHSYYEPYVQLVKHKNVIEALSEGLTQVSEIVNSLDENKLGSAYAAGKWTLKELLQHMIDSERVFCYRALRFARNDKTDLPGFEQDDYVPFSDANARSGEALLQEYQALRKATIALLQSFTDEMLMRVGVANGHKMSVRAVAFVLAGHEKHHVNVINERYL
jgi:uncharacterized damage-inducible protein DinB